MIEIEIGQETFILLPEKALLRKATNDLIIADVHLGKGTHFNKAGMPIPIASAQQDIQNLALLVHKYSPSTVIFLGDLFHSTINSEWDVFISFLNLHQAIQFILVKGNHDIIPEKYYKHAHFKVENNLEYESFILSHEPIVHDKFVICGHLHPGIKMKGKAKQSFTLPCFYKTAQQLVIPAFGQLTGLFILEKKKAESIWLIVQDKIVKV